MTINRMHDLLDQLDQWSADVRAELPPRDEHDQTEATPTHTQPLVNLGTVLKKLKTTPSLTPPTVPEPPPVKSAEELQRDLAKERLNSWLADALLLDPRHLEQWARHRKLLKPYIDSGYEVEAQAAFDRFVAIAFEADIRYVPETRTFTFILQPETAEERAGHPY